MRACCPTARRHARVKKSRYNDNGHMASWQSSSSLRCRLTFRDLLLMLVSSAVAAIGTIASLAPSTGGRGDVTLRVMPAEVLGPPLGAAQLGAQALGGVALVRQLAQGRSAGPPAPRRAPPPPPPTRPGFPPSPPAPPATPPAPPAGRWYFDENTCLWLASWKDRTADGRHDHRIDAAGDGLTMRQPANPKS